jgi:hypothetical protein
MSFVVCVPMLAVVAAAAPTPLDLGSDTFTWKHTSWPALMYDHNVLAGLASSKEQAPHDWIADHKKKYESAYAAYERRGGEFFSPTLKEEVPGSGDKRDYMTFVPYAWPCKSRPTECMDYNRKEHPASILECKDNAWIICDGKFNVEASAHLDYTHFQQMSNAVQHAAFSVAAVHPGHKFDKQALQFAVGQLRAWFIKPATAMHPRLRYSQIIPNSTILDRRYGSADCVIDFWDVTRLLDAITLIQDALTLLERQALTRWFHAFLMHISVENPKIKDLHDRHTSNHGTWYDVVYMSIAKWIGEDQLVVQQTASLKNRLDRLLDISGDMPHETTRYQSVYYYAYTLDAYAVAAELAAQVGVDVWGYENKAGATLGRTALNYIIPHISTAFDSWPHPTDPTPGAFKEHFLERPLRLAAKRGMLNSAWLLGLARFVRPKGSVAFLIQQSPDNYAIAYSFAPLRPPTDRVVTASEASVAAEKALELQCVMALSAAQARMMTQVDTFAIVPDGFQPPADVQALFDQHHVTLKHSSVHELWNASGQIEAMKYTSEVQRTMMLRFETFCMANHSRVLYLDGDAFVTKANREMWTTRPNHPCLTCGGATSPAAGSAFMIAPSFQLCASVRKTMRGPFSRANGWNNRGKMRVWPTCRCPLERMKPFCAGLQLPFDQQATHFPAKCETPDGMMPWSFYAANSDQGLLFDQCGARYQFRTIEEALQKHFNMAHYWGQQKPWKVGPDKMTSDLDGGAAFKAALQSGALDSSPSCKQVLSLFGAR